MNRLSDRINALAPSATLAMSQKSSELRAQGVDVINLSVGEPDFFTPDQLKKMDELGAIVMLHIPRHGRLKDPVNIAQIIELKQCFPNIRLIIAHIGRAYVRGDVGDAFRQLGVLVKGEGGPVVVARQTIVDAQRRLGEKRVELRPCHQWQESKEGDQTFSHNMIIFYKDRYFLEIPFGNGGSFFRKPRRHLMFD